MMTALKIIVIFLGLLIAAGVAVIGLKLIEKNDELAELGTEENAEAEPVAISPGRDMPTVRGLGLPAGSSVRRMMIDDRRLVLEVAVPDGGGRILILDLGDGGLVADLGLEDAR